jgi:hypothetical protein
LLERFQIRGDRRLDARDGVESWDDCGTHDGLRVFARTIGFDKPTASATSVTSVRV